MSIHWKPDGYTSVTPYIVVDGAEAVLQFVEKVFCGTRRECMIGENGRIMHAEVQIDDAWIMVSDTRENGQPQLANLYVYVPDTDAAYQRALEMGADSLMEPADQFYGDRNAGVRDTCGNSWWIGTHKENLSPDELARRSREQDKA